MKRKRKKEKNWAVVQELLPFGMRIVQDGLTEHDAWRETLHSKYLRAMPTDEALRINALCADPQVFSSLLRQESRKLGR